MIGYYAHHQGRGHATRARAIARHLREDVVVLSSLPAEDWAAGWVELPRDDDVDGRGADPTASGRLHWAPEDSPGYRARMTDVAEWVRRARPRLVVVDVSVEVLALVRLLGTPVVGVAMPGARSDAPHVLGYDLADRLLCTWPRDLGIDPSLAPYAAKCDFVGVVSRYDGRTPREPTGEGRTVLLLGGAGGDSLDPGGLARAREATPGWRWEVAGPLGSWHEDVWPLLEEADVVVSAAGQGAVADIAVARRPAVVVPQARAYGEQEATASMLQRHGVATVLPAWPQPGQWGGILDEAVRRPDRWGLLRATGAARRAARVLEAVR